MIKHSEVKAVDVDLLTQAGLVWRGALDPFNTAICWNA